MKPKSYREAGVDIKKEEQSIASLVSQLAYKRKGLGSPIDVPGFFTGLVDFGEWALTLNTDGVGTKLLVARDLGKWDTVGIDCVAMSVNDALCAGAEPLAMVDYLAVGKYDEQVAGQIGMGLERGAKIANISIIGGELATVPEIVSDYDLAGTCLGFVRKDAIVDGSQVEPGNVIVGLRSSGLHSNGFTLVRKLLSSESVKYELKVPGTAETWGEVLLRPTEIYVREVLDVLRSTAVAGMAHITGGGLLNLPRVNPNFGYDVDDPFEPQPVYEALREMGDLEAAEMYRTFNMGQGFALIMEEAEAKKALDILRPVREAQIIGTVTSQKGVRLSSLDLSL